MLLYKKLLLMTFGTTLVHRIIPAELLLAYALWTADTSHLAQLFYVIVRFRLSTSRNKCVSGRYR